MAVFAAHQNTTHRTLIADPVGEMSAGELGGRTVGQVRAVTFAGVDDEHSGGSGGLEDAPRRLNGTSQQRDVVAERLAESTRIDEVALHVDDQQRGGPRVEIKLVRLSGNARHKSPTPG